MITVLVDTRERRPFTRMPKDMRVKKCALPTGDYALLGDKNGLVIERKSMEDLFGTLTRGENRFRMEMERLSKFAFPVLLVEATATLVRMGDARYSEAHGPAVLNHALALCVAYGVAPMFCEGRAAAEEMAWGLLRARHELLKRRT